jgi:hypothetical protein
MKASEIIVRAMQRAARKQWLSQSAAVLAKCSGVATTSYAV